MRNHKIGKGPFCGIRYFSMEIKAGKRLIIQILERINASEHLETKRKETQYFVVKLVTRRINYQYLVFSLLTSTEYSAKVCIGKHERSAAAWFLRAYRSSPFWIIRAG